MKRTKTTDGLLSLILGSAVALAAAAPALAKGPGGGDPGGGPCDLLLDLSDIDFDGFSDLEECLGLTGNSVAFAYPGCLTTPEAVPNCLDPNVQDLFVEIHKDTTSTGTSGFDESFGGLGPILDGEVFEFIEAPASSGGLGINIHVMPQGSFDNGLRPRGVTARQSGLTVVEDRALGFDRDGNGDLICPDPPPPTGIAWQGNPNEFGNPRVLTQRIFDRIDCVFGNLQAPGANFQDKRDHVKNTVAHEVGHSIEVAPDPTSNHTGTLSGCLMDASIQPSGRKNITLPIPTVFCENSQQAAAAGITAAGQTVLCGDNTTFDGDDVEACLTPPTP